MDEKEFELFKHFSLGKNIAIVGPSPHLEGKRLGNFIDEHDLVVRVNEVSSKQNSVDFGSRTDVLFFGDYRWSKIARLLGFAVQLPSCIVLPKDCQEPELLEESRVRASEMGISLLNFDISKLGKDSESWPDSPSTGFLALVSYFKSSSKNLFVCGFSFYTGLRAYNRVKENRRKMVGYRRYTVSGHTIEDEVAYLQHNLPESGLSYDSVFEKLIVNKKFRRRNIFIFVYQVIRNSWNGALEKFSKGLGVGKFKY